MPPICAFFRSFFRKSQRTDDENKVDKGLFGPHCTLIFCNDDILH